MFKMNVKRLLSISMVLVILASFAACGGKIGGSTVNLEKYVTVEYSGINGKGRANFDFDANALAIYLLNNCSKQLNKVAKANGSGFSEIEIANYAEALADAFSVEGDAENLSNGDKATARIAFDGSLQAMEENFGLKFENALVEFTVSGLQEAVQLDLFENLNIEFQGVSPELKVSFSEKEAGKYGFYVTYSLNGGGYYNSYKIGDTLNIVATFDESDAEAKGYVVTSKEKSIVIDTSMVESYVKDAAVISQETKKIIRTESDNKAAQLFTIQNNSIDIEGTYIGLTEAESISELAFQKAYLACSDNPGLYTKGYDKAHNFICVIYKYRVNNADEKGLVWEDVPEYHYDGYVYSYLYLCNITEKNGEVKYDLSGMGENFNAFTSLESLNGYLTSNGYTYTEIQNF